MEKWKATLMAAIAVTMVCSGVSQVRFEASDHRYKAGNQVPLYANKVGPFDNPRLPLFLSPLSSTHSFFSLILYMPFRFSDSITYLSSVEDCSFQLRIKCLVLRIM